jgi:hypothetical protein
MNEASNAPVTTETARSGFTRSAFVRALRGTAWLWLLVIPPALVLLWHVRNRGWPSDDSANIMATAYQQ